MSAVAVEPDIERRTAETNGNKDAPVEKTKAKAKPKPKPKPKPPEFEVSHIEYIMFTPALDTTTKGTVRRDSHGTRSSGAARTDRFTNSRMYRTASDRVTIQTPQGEEIVLRISVLERMLERCKELQVTKEIPDFR